MNFEEWVAQVPDSIKNDPLWSFDVYRKALLLTDFVWSDCERLFKDVRGRPIADQLLRSVGSIAANIEEGFGRGYGRDYARFLAIALGSARESRGWYYRGRHLIDKKLLDSRYQLLDEIIALLVVHIKKQKGRSEK